MTPIDSVFMLSIESKLDYELLRKICMTGHSRVPVYEEVEVSVGAGGKEEKRLVKKIVGILLVKQCVLLDPKGSPPFLSFSVGTNLYAESLTDAVPLRKIPLNKVPFVPNNEPLLGILDKFQEGRSHMAIVSRFSVAKAESVKKAVKRGLTQRLRERVGMGDSSGEEGEEGGKEGKGKEDEGDGDTSTSGDGETLKGDGSGVGVGSGNGNGVRDDDDDDGVKNVKDKDKDKKVTFRGRGRGRRRNKRRSGGRGDLEAGVVDDDDDEKHQQGEGVGGGEVPATATTRPNASRGASFVGNMNMMGMAALEQSMPADAVLAKEDAEEVGVLLL
jgi:metal transporter CNNM